MKNPGSLMPHFSMVSPRALRHRDFKPSMQGHTAPSGKIRIWTLVLSALQSLTNYGYFDHVDQDYLSGFLKTCPFSLPSRSTETKPLVPRFWNLFSATVLGNFDSHYRVQMHYTMWRLPVRLSNEISSILINKAVFHQSKDYYYYFCNLTSLT